MKHILLLAFCSLAFLNTSSGQTIIWENQSLSDESAIVTGTGFTDPAGQVVVTATWSTSTDGGSFIAFEGSDFVSYESGTLGNHTGYLNAGFNNSALDPDDKITINLSFSPAVKGLTFSLLDVDEADDDDGSSNRQWDDVVEVFFNGANNANSMVASSGSCVDVDNESFANGYEGLEDEGSCGDDGADWSSTIANINYDFGTNFISSISVTYFSGDDVTTVTDPDGQVIGISDLAWTGTLPVELVDFSVEPIKNSPNMRIFWQTLTEINNHYFDVEQSFDGNIFLPIGRVEGAGYSDELLSYEIEYPVPAQAGTFYRLKQMDFDGTHTYSPVVHLTFMAETGFDLIPGSTSSELIVSGYLEEVITTCLLTDMQGRSTRYTVKLDGTSNLLDISDLPPGIYVISIPAIDQKAKKFVKKQ